MSIKRWLLLSVLLLSLFAAAAPLRAADGSQLWRQPEGFQFRVPDGWSVDASLGPVATRLSGPGVEVEVTQFQMNDDDLDGYWLYSNRSIYRGWAGIKLDAEQELSVGGLRTRWLQWHRPALARVDGDMNLYAEAALVRPGNLVWHAFLRATPAAYAGAVTQFDALLGSVTFFAPTGSSAWGKAPLPPVRDPFLQTGAGPESPLPGRLDWRLPDQPVWGIYDTNFPGDLAPAQQLERELGGHFGVYMFYHNIGTGFPTDAVTRIVQTGRLPMLTLQSWDPSDPNTVYERDTTLYMRILNGEYDSYFRQFARDAARFGHPLLFRFDNEMNGDWDPWSAFFYGKDTKLYRLTWRYVRQLFDAEGATNLLWVWNPNADSYPSFGWNNAALYYPGDDVVEWVGLTGYNTGGSSWRSFTDAYRQTYDLAEHLAPGKPKLITEFGSHDVGGDKAAWIRDMFDALPQFPAIRIAVWWNKNSDTHHYTIASAPGSKAAFAGHFPDYAALPWAYLPPSPAPAVRLELEGEWAAPAINELLTRGILAGFPDGSLRPERPVTAAEFLKLLLSARGIAPAAGDAVPGVPATHWARGWVEAAAAHGLLDADQRADFLPDAALSRQEAAEFVARLEGWGATPPVAGGRYADHARIAPSALRAVYALEVHGVMVGLPDGTFAPDRTVTRAQAATLLQRLLALAPGGQVSYTVR